MRNHFLIGLIVLFFVVGGVHAVTAQPPRGCPPPNRGAAQPPNCGLNGNRPAPNQNGGALPPNQPPNGVDAVNDFVNEAMNTSFALPQIAGVDTTNLTFSNTFQFGNSTFALLGNAQIAVTDEYHVIRSNGLPNHETSAIPGNPNTAQAQNHTFVIPRNPQLAATPTEVPLLGSIAVAINGVPFFGPYNAQGQDAILVEVFDTCNGHAAMRGDYHYHQNPNCVYSDAAGQHSPVIGFAYDGFAIYGLQDVDGAAPTDLDACNGHFGITADAPEGVYHYHVTGDYPYVLGCYSGVVSGGLTRM
jgi:hypothetical protein